MHPLVLRISMFLVLIAPAASLVAQDAASANKAFVDLQNKWMTLEKKYHEKQQANPDDKQLVAMRKESDKLLDALTTAGLEVYRIDPKGYPVVNQTLLAIANFHVLGDPNGDGGDQYEKALPMVQQLS